MPHNRVRVRVSMRDSSPARLEEVGGWRQLARRQVAAWWWGHHLDHEQRVWPEKRSDRNDHGGTCKVPH
jgi:hypothetical protein